jgi:putative phosphoribosyl transferase
MHVRNQVIRHQGEAMKLRRRNGEAAMVFLNRVDAGRKLAKKLGAYAWRADVLILGIPRGGVPVAFQVGVELGVPLDVFVVRKLGVPSQAELAFGAIASGGIRILDAEIVESLGITGLNVEAIAAEEKRELDRRERLYRAGRPALNLEGKLVILVDDGVATGASTLAAITALRKLKPARVVLAAPIAPASTYRRLRREVDDFICLDTPKTFHAIGEFYGDFSQVSDEEVTNLLQINVQQRAQEVPATRQYIRKGVHPCLPPA